MHIHFDDFIPKISRTISLYLRCMLLFQSSQDVMWNQNFCIILVYDSEHLYISFWNPVTLTSLLSLIFILICSLIRLVVQNADFPTATSAWNTKLICRMLERKRFADPASTKCKLRRNLSHQQMISPFQVGSMNLLHP